MESTKEIVKRMIKCYTNAFVLDTGLDCECYREEYEKIKDQDINKFYEDLMYLEGINSEYLPVILMMEEKLKTISDCNKDE